MKYTIRNPRLIIGGRDYSDLIKIGNIVVGPLVRWEGPDSEDEAVLETNPSPHADAEILRQLGIRWE